MNPPMTGGPGETPDAPAPVFLEVWGDENWRGRCMDWARERGFAGAEILRGEGGKPYFSGAGRWEFNVSTTLGRAVGAFAEFPVGVDWEHLGRRASFRRIAARYFQEHEAAWLEAAPLAEQSERFFLLWTAKEASVKLDGCGLYGGGLCGCATRIERGRVAGAELGGRKIFLEHRRVCGGFLLCAAAYRPFYTALRFT